MARARKKSDDIFDNEPEVKRKPATTPEARENQMIAKAIDLAEKQLEEGTASAAVITHYLKLGTMKEKYELEKLRRENELLVAKAENLQSAKRVEELYIEAMEAFKGYRSSAEAVE